MITSAVEFAALRQSNNLDEQARAGHEAAPMEVWREVIETYPHLREWVALNKSVPVEVLAQLAADSDPGVRATVAAVRRLTPELQEALSLDADPMVRARLANNAKLDRRLLETLRQDTEEFVRAAAITQLSRRAK